MKINYKKLSKQLSNEYETDIKVSEGYFKGMININIPLNNGFIHISKSSLLDSINNYTNEKYKLNTFVLYTDELYINLELIE